MREFINGQNISIAAANELEFLLDKRSLCDPFVQDVVEALASYRPGGGDFLFDEKAVVSSLHKIKHKFETSQS